MQTSPHADHLRPSQPASRRPLITLLTVSVLWRVSMPDVLNLALPYFGLIFMANRAEGRPAVTGQLLTHATQRRERGCIENGGIVRG